MTIAEVAEDMGVSWEYVLYDVSRWVEGRRQQVGFRTFEEALEAWAKQAKK